MHDFDLVQVLRCLNIDARTSDKQIIEKAFNFGESAGFGLFVVMRSVIQLIVVVSNRLTAYTFTEFDKIFKKFRVATVSHCHATFAVWKQLPSGLEVAWIT